MNVPGDDDLKNLSVSHNYFLSGPLDILVAYWKQGMSLETKFRSFLCQKGHLGQRDVLMM